MCLYQLELTLVKNSDKQLINTKMHYFSALASFLGPDRFKTKPITGVE